MNDNYDIIVIGAGVVGTFHAWAAAERGYRTLVLDRHHPARGASVRNFGMVIPSGLEPGPWRRRGLRGAEIYRSLATLPGVQVREGGTQYLAGDELEWQLLVEFAQLAHDQQLDCELLDAQASVALNPLLDRNHCRGSIVCRSDVRVEPIGLLTSLLASLADRGVTLQAPTQVVRLEVSPSDVTVQVASGERYGAKHLFLCTGDDFTSLLPDFFAALPLKRCKLHMLATEPLSRGACPTQLASRWTLRRYHGFSNCPSWPAVCQSEQPSDLSDHGIHVLIAQDDQGRLLIGDSHEYFDAEVDERLDADIERVILREARAVIGRAVIGGERADDLSRRIAQRWYGVYSVYEAGRTLRRTLQERLHIVTGLGGGGMTLSPGLAEESMAAVDAGRALTPLDE